MENKVLYKRTATGAVQRWWQEIQGDRYRTHSGQVDGAVTVSEWTVATPKSRPTAEQQAQFEVEANYTKKLAQGGYHEQLCDIDKPKFFKPMLAKNYDDHPPTAAELAAGKIYSQPKLDGMRCIATADGLWSRQGKPILSVPHIAEALAPIFAERPDLILDGEIYNHDLKDDFNTLMSLARKQKPTAEDLEAAKVLQYWVYDAPSVDGPFNTRRAILWNILRNPVHHLVPVPTFQVVDWDRIDVEFGSYLQQGYEGQIVRRSDLHYENKRTAQLLKRKEFKDAEFEIVSVDEGIGNRSGMAGSLTLKLPNGETFSSSIKGGVEFYRRLLEERDSYVGGQATVRYFHLTPDGVPRFPVATALYVGSRGY